MDKKEKLLNSDRALYSVVILSSASLGASLMEYLNSSIDKFFLGRIGPAEVASTNVYLAMSSVFFMTVGIIIFGGASVFSRRLGAQNKEGASEVYGVTMVLVVTILSLSLFIMQLYLPELVIFFGATEAMAPLALEYSRIMLFSSALTVFSFIMLEMLRAEGSVKVAFLAPVIATIVNVLLNPILIFQLDLGIRGAAFASLAGSIISVSIMGYYYLSGRSLMLPKVSIKAFKEYPIKDVLVSGNVGLFGHIAMFVIVFFTNITARDYGESAFAAATILFNLIGLVFMMIWGVAGGTKAYLSYNYGAKEYSRVVRGFLVALLSVECFAILGSIVLLLVPHVAIAIFTNDQATIEYGSVGVMYYAFVLPIVCFGEMTMALFMAVGSGKSAYSMGLFSVIFVASIFILEPIMGYNSIYLSLAIADTLFGLITLMVAMMDKKVLVLIQDAKIQIQTLRRSDTED